MKTIILDNDLKVTTIDYDKNVPQFSHKQAEIEFKIPKLTFSTIQVVYKTRVESMVEILSVDSETTDYYIVDWDIPQSATLYSGELKAWLVLKTLDGDDVTQILYSSAIIMNIVKGAISDTESEEITQTLVDEVNAILTQFGTRLTAAETNISTNTTNITNLTYYNRTNTDDTTISQVMGDKYQFTYTQDITYAVIYVDPSCAIGYMSLLNFTMTSGSLNLYNTSGKTLKVMLNGKLKSTTTFAISTQSAVKVAMVYDGMYVWCYIRTIEL